MAEVRPASNRLKEQENFTRVPNEVIEEDDLSTQAKMVWIEFWKFAYSGGGVFPGMERIAEDLNYSKKTARKYRKELEEAELLKTERRGQGKTNIYYLYVPDVDLERDTGSSQDTRTGSHKEDKDNKTKLTTQVFELNAPTDDLNLSYDDPSEHTPADLVKIFNSALNEEQDYTRRTSNWSKETGIMKNVQEKLGGGPALAREYVEWVAARKFKEIEQKNIDIDNLGLLFGFINDFLNWRKEQEKQKADEEHIDAGAPDPVEGVESMDEVRSIMEGSS